MYQQSRRILIYLVVTFLAVNILIGMAAVMKSLHPSAEELILSGTYQCTITYAEDTLLLGAIVWIISTSWIAVKNFRELRGHSTGGVVEDCFKVLMKTHMFYFASFVAVSCCQLTYFLTSTLSSDKSSLSTHIYASFLQIFEVVQMFVLGPRLILGVREYHANLVTDSDAATGMTSIAFQERVHISTGNGV
ncbi:hypothetical protein BDR07DRAFT_1426848 [Suillus spraguei]|nr:hypothetical protein BDR07DRAFT_1426848 [Suillus spraguei]